MLNRKILGRSPLCSSKGIHRTLLGALFLLSFVLAANATANDLIQPRIVGGIEAPAHAYPFMAALLHLESAQYPTLYDRQFCGGTLINESWIVTAAHCVAGTSPSQVQVGLGLHDLSTDGGEIHNVSQIIVHPDYNTVTEDADIALLRLSTPTDYEPIWLAPLEPVAGDSLRVMGWGSTANSPSSYPTELRQVDMPIVAEGSCAASYPGQLTSNMFCAGYPQGGKDSCQGDSGGPAVIYSGGAWKLQGVVSWGNGCALAGYYGIYTKVSEFGSFITQHVPSAHAPLPNPSSSKWGLWNGYLGMVNILEISLPANSSSTNGETVSLDLQDAGGNVVSRIAVPLNRGDQRDIILNQVTGFQSNSYGTARLSNTEGTFSARLVRYRPIGAGFSTFEFAVATPVGHPFSGTRQVDFNTYTLDQNQVANWLSLMNPSDSPVTMVIKNSVADPEGTSLTLEPWERRDIQAGHENPGPNHIGTLEISTSQPGAYYLAELNRYGYRLDDSLMFAVTLQPKTTTSSTFALPMSTALNAMNWLELPGYHYSVNNHYGANFIGSYHTSGRAQSMFYLRTADGTNIVTAYADQGSNISSYGNASFNLFLAMENWLELSSGSNTPVTLTIGLLGSDAFSHSFTKVLQPDETISIPLHTGEHAMSPNTYGTVSITSAGGQFSGRVLRVKKNGAVVQFIIPTSLS